MDKTNELAIQYFKKFGKALNLTYIPLEDACKLDEILEECIRTGKPYDNYIDTSELDNNSDILYD